jgi:two-component system response regulator (stage 0 sporulation protein F)
MAEPAAPVPTAYRVNCHACGAPFDALAAIWCSCLSTERTLVCPACQACGCRAPRVWKQAFWSGAPHALWQAHRELAGGSVRSNPQSSLVRRPLVLAVDDEPAIVRLAVRAVESLGCGAVTAANGLEGLQVARDYRPDVVLTDALMPGMDGREMARTLKKEMPGLKTIVFTGVYTAVREDLHARHAFQVDDYLRKPVHFKELQDALRRQLPALPSSAEARDSPREDVYVKVRLVRLDESVPGQREEITVTENLSAGGACVITGLPVAKGERVLIEELTGALRTRAAVQQVSIGTDGIPRLHLAFLDLDTPKSLLRG